LMNFRDEDSIRHYLKLRGDEHRASVGVLSLSPRCRLPELSGRVPVGEVLAGDFPDIAAVARDPLAPLCASRGPSSHPRPSTPPLRSAAVCCSRVRTACTPSTCPTGTCYGPLPCRVRVGRVCRAWSPREAVPPPPFSVVRVSEGEGGPLITVPLVCVPLLLVCQALVPTPAPLWGSEWYVILPQSPCTCQYVPLTSCNHSVLSLWLPSRLGLLRRV